MKIALGSDHRGFYAKEKLKPVLEQLGYEVEDFGTDSTKAFDYTDVAIPAATSVANGSSDRAILLCGTGLGVSISANKVIGIRAALCHDELTAQMSRQHNDANVLCLPADLIGEALTRRIVEVWLETAFEGGRHSRRVQKIMEIEKHYLAGGTIPANNPAPKDNEKQEPADT